MRPFLRSRLAIFSSEPKIAVGLIIRARADIVKPEQTGVLIAAKSNTASTGTLFASTRLEMIPVDGRLVVTDDSVRFPASPKLLLYNIPTHQTRLLPSGSEHRRNQHYREGVTMSGNLAIACAFGAALSSLGLLGFAKDAPLPHPGPGPIYDWRSHQPNRRQLHAMHIHDLRPNEAREVDRLYDQLESSSAENPQAQRWPS
jgi:hypothetical protein